MSLINPTLSINDNVSQLKGKLEALLGEKVSFETAITQLETFLTGAVVMPTAPEAPVRRGPGRPKGSKNKGATVVASAGEKRAKAWTPEMRAQAARRMKKYWRQRNSK